MAGENLGPVGYTDYPTFEEIQKQKETQKAEEKWSENKKSQPNPKSAMFKCYLSDII